MKVKLLDGEPGARRYVLVGESGEEAVSALRETAADLGLHTASLTGIGAFERASLGWFNPATGEFRQTEVEEQCELLSLTGNVSCEDGTPKLHLHVALGFRDATTRGGHLVAGTVRPTLEVILHEAPAHLERAHDPRSGLVLLKP